MATLYWPLVSALGCGQGPGGRKEPVGPVTGKPGAGLVGPGRRLGRRPSLNALFALGDLIRTSQRMDPPGPWARPDQRLLGALPAQDPAGLLEARPMPPSCKRYSRLVRGKSPIGPGPPGPAAVVPPRRSRPAGRPSVDPEVELEALILCNRTNR